MTLFIHVCWLAYRPSQQDKHLSYLFLYHNIISVNNIGFCVWLKKTWNILQKLSLMNIKLTFHLQIWHGCPKTIIKERKIWIFYCVYLTTNFPSRIYWVQIEQQTFFSYIIKYLVNAVFSFFLMYMSPCLKMELLSY